MRPRSEGAALAVRILLDTNVLIAALPETGRSDEYSSAAARELLRLSNEAGHTTCYHPASESDFANIGDDSVREWRRLATSTLPPLPDPPEAPADLLVQFGNPARGTNGWVDAQLLAAVVGDAVDTLVTEDRQVLRVAARLDLGERVVAIEDASAAVRAWLPQPGDPALLPQPALAHNIDESDTLFDSLRDDYPGFDEWFRKCKLEQRQCWTLRANGALSAFTMVKHETPSETGLDRHMASEDAVLKICSFKVSEEHPGLRYGELLLKSVFDYAYGNRIAHVYVTVFPKHEHVISFLETFGFLDSGERTVLDEVVMLKDMEPPADITAIHDDLRYHIQYGPHYYSFNANRFIIPIEPQYSRVLFPEADMERQFTGIAISSPAGNSIQKAYLSRSNSRQIAPGAILYFYRSQDRQRIATIGVAESTLASTSPDAIAAYVGKRTVYPRTRIKEMTGGGAHEVLAILFRHARTLQSGPTDAQLTDAGVWQAPPQSIMRVQPKGAEWLRTRVDTQTP